MQQGYLICLVDKLNFPDNVFIQQICPNKQCYITKEVYYYYYYYYQPVITITITVLII